MAAELSTPSAANMATARQPTPSNAQKEKFVPTSRPDRPDDEQYKAELAKAEKELKAAEERMVCTRFMLKRGLILPFPRIVFFICNKNEC